MGETVLSACKGASEIHQVAVDFGRHHVMVAGHAQLLEDLGDA